MSQPYQRKVGDFEIRILPDGRLVFVAPDEQLTDLAQTLEQPDTTITQLQEKQDNAG